MKMMCALLSAVLIITGIWFIRPQATVHRETAEDGALYVGDFESQSLPSQAKWLGRENLRADEALSARLSMDGQVTTLAEVLSDGEYEKIYLSLCVDEGQEEAYWAVVKLIRQTQPQASVYLLGPNNSQFLISLSDRRNIFYIEKL